QTRADVAEAKPTPAAEAAPDPATTDIFAAAGRLQDVAWTMRERGLDMAMCDQIADLSSAILSASSLRNPNDGRAQQLGEVLRSLERRIDVMLSATSAPPASDGSDDRPVAASGTTAPPPPPPPPARPSPPAPDPPAAPEPEPPSDPGNLAHDPIPVEPREALSASAAPEPEPAPQAAPPVATESDDFLLAPLPPPGAA